MIVDGKNAVLGRLATAVVKELLKGENIVIVNADKIIITGDPVITLKKYHERRARGSPHHGPFFPTTPEMLVRRAIRGMLPYKTKKGRAAFKKLRVYTAPPKNLEGESVNELVAPREIKTKFMTVGEVSKAIRGR